MSVPVQSRAAAALGSTHSVDVVSYKTHKSKKKESANRTNFDNEGSATEEMKDDRKGIDIKRARREIIKFGMTGFDSQKKQEAKVALAISLGAKPSRNQYKNYKLMLEEKKKEAKVEQSQKVLQQAGKNALGVSLARKKFVEKDKSKRNKLNSGLLEVYGKPTIKKNNGIKKSR